MTQIIRKIIGPIISKNFNGQRFKLVVIKFGSNLENTESMNQKITIWKLRLRRPLMQMLCLSSVDFS